MSSGDCFVIAAFFGACAIASFVGWGWAFVFIAAVLAIAGAVKATARWCGPGVV